MEVVVQTDEALNDARNIERLVENIQEAMNKFGESIGDIIENQLSLSWADKLLENWNEYNANDVPSALKQMKDTAHNISETATKMEDYSNEN